MSDSDKAAVSNHCSAAGRKGGSVCNPHKGLGNPAVMAKSIATRKSKAAALRLAAARALVASADGHAADVRVDRNLKQYEDIALI